MPLGLGRVKVARRVGSEKRLVTHLLAETGLAVLALSTMNESGGFVVEAVEAVGVLVDKGVVLRNELPADFRGIDRRVVGHHEGLRGRLCL